MKVKSESTYNVLAESISEVRIRETENKKELVRKQEIDYKGFYTIIYKESTLFVAYRLNCVSPINMITSMSVRHLGIIGAFVAS